jgi:hypothetical protein
MIPNIGIMIGGYIIFRCIELSCRAESHFAGTGARTAVVILAILGVLVTGATVLTTAQNRCQLGRPQ